MTTLEFAVLSDIHGNVWALDAVLADIRRRGISNIINLGDILYGPLDPLATAERLMGMEMLTIRGNQDRDLFEETSDVKPSSTLSQVQDRLTADHRRWLRSLPATMIIRGEVFCCHGTPESDETSMLENITPKGVFLKTSDEIAPAVAGLSPGMILCGHTHVPRTVALADGRLVVNPGSVGLPAYTDDLPFPHAMESGSPHARYAVIRHEPHGWSVESISLQYDWLQAARTAEENGRSDWAAWLATGRAG